MKVQVKVKGRVVFIRLRVGVTGSVRDSSGWTEGPRALSWGFARAASTGFDIVSVLAFGFGFASRLGLGLDPP